MDIMLSPSPIITGHASLRTDNHGLGLSERQRIMSMVVTNNGSVESGLLHWVYCIN